MRYKLKIVGNCLLYELRLREHSYHFHVISYIIDLQSNKMLPLVSIIILKLTINIET